MGNPEFNSSFNPAVRINLQRQDLRINCADTLTYPPDFLRNPLNSNHENRFKYMDIGIGSLGVLNVATALEELTTNISVDAESKFGLELLLDFPGDGSESPQILAFAGFDFQPNNLGYSTVVTQLSRGFDEDQVALRRSLTRRGSESYRGLDYIKWRPMLIHYLQQFSVFLRTKNIDITDIIMDSDFLDSKRTKSLVSSTEEILAEYPYKSGDGNLWKLPINEVISDERTQKGFLELLK